MGILGTRRALLGAASAAPQTYTVNYQVATGTDDAREIVATGAMQPGSSDIVLGDYGQPYHAGVRFTGVTITAGATIDAAYLQFHASTNDSGDDLYLDIYGHDTASPGTFTTAASNISGRDRTTASVAYDEPADWTGGTWYDSPSLTTIVQELVDSHDYSSGAPMVFLFIYDSGSRERLFEPYDQSTTLCAKLVIQFTTAA